jgi:hypothetical protein
MENESNFYFMCMQKAPYPEKSFNHSMSKLISNRINIVHGTVSWSLKELKQTIMRTIAPITYMAQASLFTHIPLVRYGALAAYLLYAYQ